MESSAGIVRLGRMAGVASLDRNLATEDALYKHDLLSDEGGQPATDNNMRIMAARDVYVNSVPQAASLPPTSEQPAESPPAKLLSSEVETIRGDQTRTIPKPAGTLVKAAIAAVLLASGAGASIGGAWAMGMFDPPQKYELRLEVE